MRTVRLVSGVGIMAILLWAFAVATMAQQEVPPPYAGLKNPFPWDDGAAREAGKGVYQRACLGCHGASGGSLPGADFSNVSYPQNVEQRPDFFFWMVSEGRLDRGMPPFKSTLSEEQRWQVLNYIWSLGKVASPPPPPVPPPPASKAVLTLSVPREAKVSEPLAITATLKDERGKPIADAKVKFLVRADFFAKGLMEIGEATTDAKGIATLEYVPRSAGSVEVVTRADTAEAMSTIMVVETGAVSYHTDAGLQLPAAGKKEFLGPDSAFGLGEQGEAPTSALWLPAGTNAWLFLFALPIVLIWLTYFRAMYQVFRIPVVAERQSTNTRLIPSIGLVIIVVLGISLVLFIITGPISHLNLLR